MFGDTFRFVQLRGEGGSFEETRGDFREGVSGAVFFLT
jgi:hypothetical protein